MGMKPSLYTLVFGAADRLVHTLIPFEIVVRDTQKILHILLIFVARNGTSTPIATHHQRIHSKSLPLFHRRRRSRVFPNIATAAAAAAATLYAHKRTAYTPSLANSFQLSCANTDAHICQATTFPEYTHERSMRLYFGKANERTNAGKQKNENKQTRIFFVL